MGDTTKIEWADHTASPWYGCSHAVLSDGAEHEGCANCYAEALAKRNPAILGVWGTEGTRVLSKSFSKNCETWNKQADKLASKLNRRYGNIGWGYEISDTPTVQAVEVEAGLQ